ncbi:MAG: response regulator [Ardenticatenia bacterium]|nr:response regulator [Ardenticatenia bacterium]
MADTQAPLRVLLVEDDMAAAKLYRWVLMNEGFEVISATSGEEGYTLATEHTPDLIIIDVVLPGIDGYTLCRRLRQNVVTRTIPVLLLSAKGDIADKIAGLEAGADDYLAKPFHPEELAYRVKALLARYRAPTVPGANVYARGQIIAFFSSKGGVGKTTIAVNLARGPAKAEQPFGGALRRRFLLRQRGRLLEPAHGLQCVKPRAQLGSLGHRHPRPGAPPSRLGNPRALGPLLPGRGRAG